MLTIRLNYFGKSTIFYHLNIFNSNKFQREFKYYEIDHYFWKSYLQNICIVDDEIYSTRKRAPLIIPVNVVSLAFKNFNQELWPGFIPFENRVSPIESLDLGKKYSHPLKKGDIPPTIKKVILSDVYNHPLKQGDIPNSTEAIVFGNRWDQVITHDSLPSSIKSIRFGNDYNNRGLPFKASCLPKGLESIRFGISFNQILDANSFIKYTPNLKTLQVHSKYTHQLTFKNIPPSVTELFLGINTSHTSQKLIYEYRLPDGIRRLTLGDYVTAPIEPGYLPNGITDLSLGSNNKVVHGSIPNTVTKLDLGLYYNRELPSDSLPESLTHLVFAFDYDTKLAQNQFINTRNLTTIEFGAFFSRPIAAGTFPKNLTTLKFGRNMNPDHLELCAIPDSVTSLQIVPNFRYSNIPKNLRKLKLINFDKDIPPSYFNSEKAPESLRNLEILSLGDNFNTEIKPSTFPNSLTKLDLGYKYNHPLRQEILPPNLSSLSLGQCFTREIKEDDLPQSLLTLKVMSATPKLTRKSIPPNLNSLFCLNTNKEFLKSIDLHFFFSFLKIIENNYS
ncbi:hypothetical protein DICPUDRAFT_99857 [Dictyostelium purpureum]|uniref:FNIP repeat-containing protein n=1 Tax=Dictyostelium purpureum TaxID=5786 RepID=F1A369_DICPU|nr:uncharacterized protein DICPUDRAFT_99857 [Dictyostelium purpureum]EGC29359.1 hypothetical protein DICPUDRAFT_99857 [Dictyostelium purpureum]|eukprot:XP_003294113.1 hypothetical protein DICPUDRAFT_99857 [Dictyostelium purpureum]